MGTRRSDSTDVARLGAMLALGALVAGAVGACDGSIVGGGGLPVTPVVTPTRGGSDAGATQTTADSGTPQPVTDGGVTVYSSELPCAAYDVLAAHCWSCHGAPPTGGAPQSLLTLATLRAIAPSTPGVSNGARSVVRMQATAAPMPPAPNAPVPGADTTAFAAWVDAGMPAGSCTSATGAPPDGGPPPPPDPLGAAPTCTSGTTWSGGTSGSPQMEPGQACLACHAAMNGPGFTVAGTVYPTGHEPDDCNGTSAAGAVVTVTDRNGLSARFTASGPSGNFHGTAALTFPITATVTFQGRTRAMATPVSSGDCNGCHTQSGANGAPGRITLPF